MSTYLLVIVVVAGLVDGQQLLSNPRCNSWPDRGTCEQEFVVKWYYDRYDHRCRRFFYGGCEGNDNRYDSLEECTSQCQFVEQNNRDRCFQPHDPGTCNSDIERWYFDQDQKRCVCSWWSGCGGNSNIYYSYNHCMLICGEYAEQGPGLDEKYWNRQKNHTMSIESQMVFSNPHIFRKPSEESYSVQVPSDVNHFVTINISHRDDSPNNQQYLHSAPLTTVLQNGVTIHRYDSEPRQLQELPRMVNMNSPNDYKIKFDQEEATQYDRISESLRNEAEETQRRIQEAMRRRVIEQQMNRQQPRPQRDSDMVEQFKSHLQEHERSLRAKLEAQFPDHVIVLTPEIETVRHPDGRNVVRQRIQWTAHPKATYTNQVTVDRRQDEAWRQRQAEKRRYLEERQRMKAARYSTTTTPEPTTVIETTTAYIDDRIYIPTATYPVPLPTESRPVVTTPSWEVLQEQRRQEWLRSQTTTQPVRTTPATTTPSLEVRRREEEEKRRRQYEEWLRSRTTTTERTMAEPIEHHRPLIEHVTSAPLSIEDIIAMDNQKHDYDDEYDVPLDFPETSPPRTTTTPSPRRRPPPSPSNPLPGAGAPIVLPPKKSKLFSEPSSEEYAQEVDFDPYVDFVGF